MAVLIRPKRWGQQKPPAGTQIDWSHPLANGLEFCVVTGVGGQPIDLVRGGIGGLIGGTVPPTAGPYGAYYLNATAGTSSIFTVPDAPFITARGMSLVFGGSIDVGGQFQNLMSKASSPNTNGTTNSPFDFRTDAQSIPVLNFVRAGAGVNAYRIYNGPSINTSSPGSGGNKQQTQYALTVADNLVETLPTFYVGALAQVGTVNSAGSGWSAGVAVAGGAGPLSLGRRLDGATQLVGHCRYAYAYNRRLHADEVAWLYTEPYAFMLPQAAPRRYYNIPLQLGVARVTRAVIRPHRPAPSINSSKEVARGLVGAWANNGVPMNAVTGELASMASPVVAGHADGGLAFSLVPTPTGAVTLHNGPILAGLSSFSIMVLARVTNNSALYCERGASGNAILKLESTLNDFPRFTYRNDGGTLLQLAGSSVPLNPAPPNDGGFPWHVVVLVKNGSSVTLYQNGVVVASTNSWAGNDTLTQTGIVTRLGSDAGDSTLNALGSIGTTAVWNRALDAASVKELSANPWTLFAPRRPLLPTSKPDLPDLPVMGGLVGWWKADAP